MRHIHRKTIMYASIIACVTVVSFPRATEACGESCISCQRLSRGSRSLGRETTDTQVSFFFLQRPKTCARSRAFGKGNNFSPGYFFFLFYPSRAPTFSFRALFTRACGKETTVRRAFFCISFSNSSSIHWPHALVGWEQLLGRHFLCSLLRLSFHASIWSRAC